MTSHPSAATYRFAFDIGGTFTDLVLISSDGRVLTAKVLTGVGDVITPIRAGLEAMLSTHGIAIDQIADVVVGATTAVTNLIIERKGAKTGLITTAGFRDVIEIARELRFDLYNLLAPGPDPVVPRALRREIDERVDAAGQVVRPAHDAEIEEVLRALVADGVQAVRLEQGVARGRLEEQVEGGHYVLLRGRSGGGCFVEERERERTASLCLFLCLKLFFFFR